MPTARQDKPRAVTMTTEDLWSSNSDHSMRHVRAMRYCAWIFSQQHSSSKNCIHASSQLDRQSIIDSCMLLLQKGSMADRWSDELTMIDW